MTAVEEKRSTGVVEVCAFDRLIPGRGVAALLPDGRQVAIFRTVAGEVYALSNVDPFTRAAVLSRGIIGDVGGVPHVASPMLKHRFELATGHSLEDDAVAVRTYPVRVVEGVVYVQP
ncbi:nitrite reductase small subunit NirD [Amycolatopsis thermophila]|uniref:Nitrite reductase (NADH) small subunit n=1 Tax=Amycolatopsis thermophila TaxID=206084 RepID=A0ABU0EPI9_9PSEU|nr:nitrite reductase small subunit NirD [Amycolatopsis thermophila]MDQ0377208.1 nitrite reductase (NADH) small subunit [Amycolatopsis thermophila]